MTLTLQHFQFQVYYSQEFNLYDLVVNKNKEFHSHYHLSTQEEVQEIINKYIQTLECNQ